MRQKETIGAFVRVPIDETYHTYGRMINRSVYAFYDFKTDSETVDLDSIEGSAVLFKLMVIKDAVTKGYWKKIGIKELPEDLKAPVPFFKQEVGLPNDCSIIFVEGSNIKKVSPEDCVGLERFAAWEHDHVEQRLRDHYNGVRNVDSYMLRVNGPLT
jgi:hypothetical protein